MNNPQSLTVDFAKECREHFLELLKGGDEVFVDMTEIAEIDIAGLQILVGLLKQSVLEKKKVRLTGDLSGDIQSRIMCCGICGEPCSTGVQLEQALRAFC
jgi:hypothetical protein